jgi:hypothetical protein
VCVGVGVGVAVVVGVGVGEAVTVADGVAVGVGVGVADELVTEADGDWAADACPAAADSSGNPMAIKAAPASAHSRAARDSRLDRELKVFLASGVSGTGGVERALRS